MITRIGVSISAIAALFLGACSHGIQISEHAIDYNVSVEQSENDMLLKNILRASEKGLMYFTRINQIQNTLNSSIGTTVTSQFGAASELLSGQTSPVNFGSKPFYVMQIFNTEKFYNGFNKPLDPDVAQLFLNDGWPIELLIFAIAEEVLLYTEGEGITSPCKIIGKLDGGPINSVYHEREKMGLFADLIQQELIRTISRNYQPFAERIDLKTLENIKALQEFVDKYPIDITTATPTSVQLQAVLDPTHTLIHSKAARADTAPGASPDFIDRARLAFLEDSVSLCDDDEVELLVRWTKDRDFRPYRKFSARLTLRSARGVFYALGEMLNATRDNPEVAEDIDFFQLESGLTAPSGVISAEFRGLRYWIPEGKRGNDTRRLLALARQLFSMNASSDEAPTASLLRIINN